jgi:hypothetical protein
MTSDKRNGRIKNGCSEKEQYVTNINKYEQYRGSYSLMKER